MGTDLIEPAELSNGSPALVAAPRMHAKRRRDRLELSGRVVPLGALVCECLLIDEALRPRRDDGLLIETLCVGRAPFEPGELGSHRAWRDS